MKNIETKFNPQNTTGDIRKEQFMRAIFLFAPADKFLHQLAALVQPEQIQLTPSAEALRFIQDIYRLAETHFCLRHTRGRLTRPPRRHCSRGASVRISRRGGLRRHRFPKLHTRAFAA